MLKAQPNQTISSDEIAVELKKYNKTKVCSEELGELFIRISETVGSRKQFISYSFREDMVANSILKLLKYTKNFNSKRSKSAFNYCYKISYFSFVEYLRKYYKDKNRKDEHDSLKKLEYEKIMENLI